MRTQIQHLVSHAAAAHGSRIALSVKDVSLTYAELDARIAAFASGLQRLGASRADRVAVYLDKRIETVVALLGAAAAGGVFVPVNPLLRAAQVEHVLRDSGARVLVTTPERLETLAAALGGLDPLEHIVVVGPSTTGLATSGHAVTPWDVVVDAPTVTARHHDVDTDVAAILYTSGSTGRPKGVVLSHRNLIAGAESVSSYLGNTADDVILSALPLSFDAGLSQLTTAFSVGAQVVLMNYLLPGDVVRLCATHRVTGLTCVPPLWNQIADQRWPDLAGAHLRYFANTGGRMPRTTLDRLRSIFPQARPFLMYGLTEAFRSTYLDPEQVERRPDSIGRAIPNAEILVLRPDGSPCLPGEPGELVHRGATVSLGYWNDPELTATRFRPVPAPAPGVVTTELAVWSGDTVYRDEEGYLYFVGRTDEMIKTSGYRVSPTELEEVAYASGLVRDVVALGVEDPRLDQHVVLVASAPTGRTLDADGLLEHFRRQVPLYMVPHRVVAVEELPRSPNGKLDRTRIREELVAP